MIAFDAHRIRPPCAIPEFIKKGYREKKVEKGGEAV